MHDAVGRPYHGLDAFARQELRASTSFSNSVAVAEAPDLPQEDSDSSLTSFAASEYAERKLTGPRPRGNSMAQVIGDLTAA